MNRKKVTDTLSSATRGVSSRLSSSFLFSTARFRGKLGSAIAVITSLIVGFLTLPSNILYFIDSSHSTRLKIEPEIPATVTPGSSDSKQLGVNVTYIHSGIALIVLGCLAMVVSVVLSYFAAKSKLKLDDTNITHYSDKSTRTVVVCLVMMNVELFMAVIAGCMELLYRPLIHNVQRLHNVECTIAVFNIVIYLMYVVSMILTSTVLRGQETVSSDPSEYSYTRDHRDMSGSGACRDYMTDRTCGPYSSQSGHMVYTQGYMS